MPIAKEIKGEKYIYLAMGYRLAKGNGGIVKIGNDNGFVGGQMFERWFHIQIYQNQTLLVESKNTPNMVSLHRYYAIGDYEDNPRIYINEYYEGEDNMSKGWSD
jgi:hypothetical protein